MMLPAQVGEGAIYASLTMAASPRRAVLAVGLQARTGNRRVPRGTTPARRATRPIPSATVLAGCAVIAPPRRCAEVSHMTPSAPLRVRLLRPRLAGDLVA